MLGRLRTLRASILTLAITCVVFEVVLRFLQGGCYNYLPYRLDGLIPTLPPSADFCVINSSRAHIAYSTDREGARRASRDRAQVPCDHCVMTVGDSQALGYGIPYESTFTAIYAARKKRQSLLVAAPTDEPDRERLATARYVASTETIPDTVFVVINLGNDVDELYSERHNVDTRRAGASSWLPEHSFVYADLALATRVLMHKLVHTSALPPGTNPVVYALAPSDLPVVEAELASDAIAIAEETKARNAVTILIPPDDVVAASEFAKYRRFYTASEYELWRSRLPHMAAVMTKVEDGLAKDLRARKMHVLDTRHILELIPPALAFDRYSHHLTPLANRMIANNIP